MASVDQTKVRHLQGFAGDISQSILVGVLMDNHNDMEKATDEVLTMNLELEEVQTQLEERKAQLQRMGREQLRREKELAEEEARWMAEKEAKEAAEAAAQAQKVQEIERASREAEQKLAEDEAKLAEFYNYINKAEEQHVAAERKRIAAEQARLRANKEAEIAEVQKKLSEEKALMELAFAEQREETERRRREFEEQQLQLKAEREEIEAERKRLEEIKREADEAVKQQQIKDLKERKRLAEEKKKLKKEREKARKQRRKKDKKRSSPREEAAEAKADAEPAKPADDDLEDELTKEFENSQIIDTSAEEAPIPKVMILENKAAEQTEEDDNETKELLTFLVKYGVDTDEDVKFVDVSHDAELAGFVHERVNQDAETPVQIKYPFVCIHGRTVGQLSDLKRLAAAGQFRDLLNKEDVDLDVRVSGTGVYVGQGILDHCLDAAEYVASGVSSMLLLPVTLVTWPFRSGAANSTPEGIDFDVVHTNWYWRNLKRKFRFCEESFLRIHPRHNDVRATHAYETVKTIRFSDTTNISIEYNDGSATDYITATEADCNQIVSIIQKHNPSAEVFSLHEL
mmetsp:Transcript_114475/g.160692  ORF Transcript_114475/g.160692 Transcript_114475/m.160692 type:complete len:572 (-) Transcript_114475:75-1790(-)